jgi:ribosome-binding protein aMBF1 (putative translation factor)
MSDSLGERTGARHVLLPDKASGVAKAALGEVRKADLPDARVRVGLMVRRCRALSGLLLKEFADELKRDERQVARWESGEDRAQVDAFEKSEKLWPLWLQAQAETTRAAGVKVKTTIEFEGPREQAS